MAQQRTQYSNAILQTYKPVDAAKVLKSRISSAEILNIEIADWFKERARIEQNYAAELERHGKKNIAELSKSGLFEGVWLQVLSSTRENAKAASSFATKIHKEIEAPLRQYTTRSAQWADMKVLQSELETLANTVKLDKHRNTRANDENRVQWESQAPFLLEQAETIDESRLGYLKNALTTYGTVEADYSDKSLKISEKVLNNVLSYEPMDEIATYAAQVGRGEELAASHSLTSSHFNRPGSIAESLTHASTNNSNGLYENPHDQHASSSSKLRSKVGSIFRSSKKKKDKSVPSFPSPASVPAPTSLHSSPQRGGTGSVERYRPGPASYTSSENDSPQSPPNGPSSPPANATLGTRKPPPPPSRKANGGGAGPISLSAAHRELSSGNNNSGSLSSPISLSAPPRSAGPEPIIEEESYERHNIVETVKEEEEEEEGKQSSVPLKFDIKPESNISTPGSNDDDVALSVIASTLRQRNTVSGRGQRGRRDIQSTLFTNIPPSGVESPTQPQSPAGGFPQTSASHIKTLENPSLPSVNEADTHSILSDQSSVPISQPQSLIIGSTLAHPRMPSEPGLNSSIVEVVSAVVKDGVVSRAQLVGEVAFKFQGSISTPLNLRVSNLGIFDTFSPNSTFIQSVDTDPNNYLINHEPISAGQEIVGFKFMSQNAEKFVPVDFSPIWRVEKNQSSLMLTYKVANSYLRESPIVLRDLVISVPVEGGHALSAVSKPHAVFNKAKQRIVWKFDEPVVVKAGFEEKLLCRFSTDGPAKESVRGIEIKFRVVNENPDTEIRVVNQEGDESDTHRIQMEYSEGAQPPRTVNSIVTVASGKFGVHSEQNVQVNIAP